MTPIARFNFEESYQNLYESGKKEITCRLEVITTCKKSELIGFSFII